MDSSKRICYNCFREISGGGACPFCGYDPGWDVGRFPVALPHGTILAGQYITGRVLGQGGFGITYIAFDPKLERKFAIKEFMPNTLATRVPGAAQVSLFTGDSAENFNYGKDKFLDEARVLAKFIGNPNIVGVHNFFEENGTAYFTMDYIEGRSFQSYIKAARGRIPWQDAVRIMLPVLDALEAVHRAGIIHRDVTPDNIYITGDNVVRLLDFGAARYSLGNQSRSLDVVLKHGYAPKEQYARRGKQGPFTDVYSTAACLYRAITGRIPPDAMERIDNDEIIPPDAMGIHIPEALEAVIMKGLEQNAGDRYQSMAEFRSAINNAVASEPESSPIPVPIPQPVQPEPIAQQSVQPRPVSFEPIAPQSVQPQSASFEPVTPQSIQPKSISFEPPASEPVPEAVAEPITAEPTSSAPPAEPQTPKKAKNKWLIPLCAGAGALVVLAVLLIILIPGAKPADKPVILDLPDSSTVSSADGGDKSDADSSGKDDEPVVPEKIAVSAISLDNKTLELKTGDVARLSVMLLPDNATDKSIKWTSSDETVATVDFAGSVQAKGEGSATITATASSGLTANCAVTVTNPIIEAESIALNAAELTLETGETAELAVTFTPADTSDTTISWQSSDEGVAAVDGQGRVSAKSVGTAAITATTANGKTAACAVTVVKPVVKVTEVKISQTTATLRTGDTLNLSASVLPSDADDKSISWQSSDSSIATVNSRGVVSIVGSGNVTISATAASGVKASCAITVKYEPGRHYGTFEHDDDDFGDFEGWLNADGYPDGEGTYTSISGIQYSGSWTWIPISKQSYNEPGTFFGLYTANNYYGLKRSGLRCGWGHISFGSAFYIGEWVDGQVTGRGYVRYEDGSCYYGFLVNGKRNGEGWFKNTTGKYARGYWENDVLIDEYNF